MKTAMTSQCTKFSKLLAAFGMGSKGKLLKKLSAGSRQQIKRRLEMISPALADVWSHGYLLDNQE